MKRLFDIDPWKIKTTVLNIEEKRLQESLTAIGNGYMSDPTHHSAPANSDFGQQRFAVALEQYRQTLSFHHAFTDSVLLVIQQIAVNTIR